MADSDLCIDITNSNEHVYRVNWIVNPENSQRPDITLTRVFGTSASVQGH